MLKRLPHNKMGTSNLGWLESTFHFSFAQYRNPENVNFGVLRVLNDDIIHPQSGFDTHPHHDMEIISYIIDGEITHEDSMGNKETLKRGEVQYLSAGEGIFHSEHNRHPSKDLRLLQLWIIPPEKGLPRLYGSHRFKEDERHNVLLKIVSSKKRDAPINIYQDVQIFVGELDKHKVLEYAIEENRQVYFVQVEGYGQVNDVRLDERDAMEITHEKLLHVKALTKAHVLFIDMPSSYM